MNDLAACAPALRMWRAWNDLGVHCKAVGCFKFRKTEYEYRANVAEADRLLALIEEKDNG